MYRKLVFTLIIIVAALAILVVALPSNPLLPQREEVRIMMADGAWERFPEQEYFRPSEIVVILGVNNTVTWTNEDFSGRALHDVVSEDGIFMSGLLGPGESWAFTFEELGEYPYHCDPHPWMQGMVIVTTE